LNELWRQRFEEHMRGVDLILSYFPSDLKAYSVPMK
jgi:hypothetical protein